MTTPPARATLTENHEQALRLTPTQVRALQALGRRLATTTIPREHAGTPVDRTLIRCRPIRPGVWGVTVVDAIGLLAVPGMQLEVQPKIPLPHLLYLFAQAGALPRLDTSPLRSLGGSSLWELIARWYLQALSGILRRGLVRDYRPQTDVLPSARGRIDPLPTAHDFYRGRLALHCEFDEFDDDTPANRVLRAAAERLVASPCLPGTLRRDARRALAALSQVGDLQPADLRAELDRRSQHYHDGLTLARHVLAAHGRIPRHGEQLGFGFLLRTPDLAEAGLRALLQAGLREQIEVRKATRSLRGSARKLNPDLVFGHDDAVGDIKYKLARPDWRRPDLYQLAAFATGFHTYHGLLVGFAEPNTSGPRPVQLGGLNLVPLHWLADPASTPEAAADGLLADVGRRVTEQLRAPT